MQQNNNEQQVVEQFKKMVIEWVRIDDEIKSSTNELKQLKNERKELENLILDFMSDENKNIPAKFQITDGMLRKSVSKTKGALKHEFIKNSLLKIFNDVKKAEDTTEYILSSRPVTERIKLKRTYNRKKKDNE